MASTIDFNINSKPEIDYIKEAWEEVGKDLYNAINRIDVYNDSENRK